LGKWLLGIDSPPPGTPRRVGVKGGDGTFRWVADTFGREETTTTPYTNKCYDEVKQNLEFFQLFSTTTCVRQCPVRLRPGPLVPSNPGARKPSSFPSGSSIERGLTSPAFPIRGFRGEGLISQDDENVHFFPVSVV
jgi:hypothetical protein